MPESCTRDDQDMLRRVGAGDRQALADLYLRYRQSLFQYLLRLTPDRGLAEDLLQETFVAVWQSASRFEGRSSVQTWLIGVARRQAYNRLRQRAAQTTDAGAKELEALAAPDPEPENAALARASREELGAAIARLSPVHREVLALAFGQELSGQEMAAVLGVPIGTVRSRLRDAKRALRTILRGGEEGAGR
jgi:RNA polymerase sigma-70 factor (ECF subfamily)